MLNEPNIVCVLPLRHLHFALILHLSGLLLHPSQFQSFLGMSWMKHQCNSTGVKGEMASNVNNFRHENSKVWAWILTDVYKTLRMTLCPRKRMEAITESLHVCETRRIRVMQGGLRGGDLWTRSAGFNEGKSRRVVFSQDPNKLQILSNMNVRNLSATHCRSCYICRVTMNLSWTSKELNAGQVLHSQCVVLI